MTKFRTDELSVSSRYLPCDFATVKTTRGYPKIPGVIGIVDRGKDIRLDEATFSSSPREYITTQHEDIMTRRDNIMTRRNV